MELTSYELHLRLCPIASKSYGTDKRRSLRNSCMRHRTIALGTQTATADRVSVTMERAARNTRRLYAGVDIAAPVEVVWGALTDYDGLGNFIPGLAENRCLERRPHGAKLLQIGEQDIALGAKFRAKVILDIQEYVKGVPQSMCMSSRSDQDMSVSGSTGGIFPEPQSLLNGKAQDIAFSMVEGDFAAFRGIWRMQPGCNGKASSRLSYSLHVQPQPWLPVRLIQGRIEGEVRVNLAAVRDHSERLWQARQARKAH